MDLEKLKEIVKEAVDYFFNRLETETEPEQKIEPVNLYVPDIPEPIAKVFTVPITVPADLEIPIPEPEKEVLKSESKDEGVVESR